ncbi:lysosome membrane protein 2 [Folsomia candida]|uniref:lysosome membrane protein 2 n=1 Tax=Folsomia candida TaxID=158441 RepID=UPI000B8F7A9B|nr:lysosome membrane protein 2 [Folsomia candida]
MNKQPLLLCVSIFLILVLVVTGLVVTRRFGGRSSLDLDYDAEVDVENVGNVTAATLWDLHRDIKTKNKFKIYLFQVLNPQAVLEGENPELKEAGPFAYNQKKTRVTLGIYEESDTVRYKDHVTYHFNQAESKGNDSDIVTIINMPWVGLAQEVSRMSAFSRFIVMAIVSRYSESVFMTRPVGELLFGGFYHELISTFSGITGETYMPNNTFGFLYGRNDTFLDSREVNLGLKNPLHFGHTRKWKGLKEMEWWSRPNSDDSDWFDEESSEDKHKNTCNQISESSDWSLFHPGINKEEYLSVFADDLCRNLKLSFEKEVNLQGVKGYRFTVPRSEYGNPKNHPENSCYCTQPGEDMEDCPHDGVYQINACQKAASVLISHPHFYNGDKTYLQNVKGLNPKLEHHQTFIDIEPITGQVLRYAKRAQVNLHLRPLKSITEFNKVPNMIFPVMWTEETAEMDDDALVELKAKLAGKKFTFSGFQPPVLVNHLGFMSSDSERSRFWMGVTGGLLILPVGLVGLFLALKGTNWSSKFSHPNDTEGVEFTEMLTEGQTSTEIV